MSCKYLLKNYYLFIINNNNKKKAIWYICLIYDIMTISEKKSQMFDSVIQSRQGEQWWHTLFQYYVTRAQVVSFPTYSKWLSLAVLLLQNHYQIF